MISRRNLIAVTGGTLLVSTLPGRILAADTSPLQQAISTSDLIYLTPIRTDGSESSCQAEVWFVAQGQDLYVVSSTASWRIKAVKQGLNKARIWVGDLGQWRGTDGKYKSLPGFDGMGAEVTETTKQQQILDLFGAKYPVSWLVYGPRFKDGLADGSRTMVRFQRT